MKLRIAVALLLVSTATFAQEAIDAKFPALLTWAQWLSDNSAEWDALCQQNPMKEGCPEMRAILTEQYVMFIEAANRYTTEGTDCRAILRPRSIKYEIMVATFNINCAGKASTEGCVKSHITLKTEEKALQKEIDKCETEKL